ncbi:hypothetical protein K469DRAFT_334338 [Zopfia rhizophila CBS 207.26]|uniref:Uncharacterized protein n=1 Tax=Zopfia rhizophila CBS 207.26 TaxID=1314779 RepID=A0A6A6DL03_9PEZI|nr:hypothetical protein K469DRAFT_334338 [Zopfia rhizophila CBS 207.26]
MPRRKFPLRAVQPALSQFRWKLAFLGPRSSDYCIDRPLLPSIDRACNSFSKLQIGSSLPKHVNNRLRRRPVPTMPTDKEKCEALVAILAYVTPQDVYTSDSTIYNNGNAILVARTTNGTTKRVNFALPALRTALRSHAQYGFGHPLDREGVRWEFRTGKIRSSM